MKIGVFDSGLGGLTVLKALWAHLPAAHYCYLGDTARVPYGIRSRETVVRYATQCLSFLAEQKIDLCVIACNTVSAYALEELGKQFSFPIVGVVEPGVEAVRKREPKGGIGVIGTEATVQSGAYEKALSHYFPSAQIISRACPILVPLVEVGWLDHPVTDAAVAAYMGDFADLNIQMLVLGCTHYPLLKPAIQRFLGDEVVLLDSAEEVALAVKARYGSEFSSGRGTSRFFVTDAADRFDRLARLILGHAYMPVSQIRLKNMA